MLRKLQFSFLSIWITCFSPCQWKNTYIWKAGGKGKGSLCLTIVWYDLFKNDYITERSRQRQTNLSRLESSVVFSICKNKYIKYHFLSQQIKQQWRTLTTYINIPSFQGLWLHQIRILNLNNTLGALPLLKLTKVQTSWFRLTHHSNRAR